MQLGHEPLPIRETTTLITRSPARMLPNVIEYLGHIFQTDGIRGCFRGLSANLLGLIVSLKLSPILVRSGIEATGRPVSEIVQVPEIINDEEAKPDDYYKVTRLSMIVHTANLVISYPFYVVSMRMMAAFIGREDGYSTMPAAVASIIKDNSIFGFYGGFIPRLISDLYTIATTGVIVFYVNKYLFKTKQLRKFSAPLVDVTTSPVTFFYPLVLSSTCMAVAGSSLQAGKPPNMPPYAWWLECLWDLFQTSQTKRGAALFFRYVPDKT